MKVLGIDPGFETTGMAIVTDGEYSGFFSVTTNVHDPAPVRLAQLYATLLAEIPPDVDVIVIETPGWYTRPPKKFYRSTLNARSIQLLNFAVGTILSWAGDYMSRATAEGRKVEIVLESPSNAKRGIPRKKLATQVLQRAGITQRTNEHERDAACLAMFLYRLRALREKNHA